MEECTMAQQSKRAYLRSIYHRYNHACRKAKTAILEEFTTVCGYNRKYAIWLLNRPLPPEGLRVRRVAARLPTYSEAMVRMLAAIWETSGYLCGQRLKAALPHWLPWVRRRFRLTASLERHVLAISPRQMDRRLHPYKQRIKRRLYGTTRPGSLLKHMIPIKTDHWDVTKPGYLEIDLVSHSGASASGEFIYTLDCVDIQTGWVERQAVMGKGREGILHALQAVEQQLPFPLRGIDSDNGSEFINTHLLAFCQRPGGQTIQFTRSRPYKKDYNAHVEQKNWTHVRKLIGWDRYDSPEALHAMNALDDELRIFQNLFQPSMKLLMKVRKGSRLIRRYDTPRTPFARVLECAEADPASVAALRERLKRTDPFELSRRIDRHLECLYHLAHRDPVAPRERVPLTRSRPRASASSSSHAQPRRSPWRGWTFSKTLTRQQQEMQQHVR